MEQMKKEEPEWSLATSEWQTLRRAERQRELKWTIQGPPIEELTVLTRQLGEEMR